jgi:quinol monooxygenase YgiN
MYAAIRRYELLPTDVPELRRRVQAGFLPIVGQVPGFISYDLLEAENGVVVTVSIFADEAAAQESSRRAAAWVDQEAADLIHQTRQYTTGEVTIHQAAPLP